MTDVIDGGSVISEDRRTRTVGLPKRPAARHAEAGGLRSASRAFAGAVGVALVLALSLVVAPAPAGDGSGTQAAAATVSAADFDPGNIISDEVLYDGRALSKKQIQRFLKQRVPACHSGPAGPDCLRNYRQETPTMAKDEFCTKKYRGKKNQSAARIIAKVGRACGVSQKVLLMTLQKEQGLVTSTAPTEFKYSHAAGYGCPDTASCDPRYEGFFYQVYYAARLYQRLRDPSQDSSYPAGQRSDIYFQDVKKDPKHSCGAKSVYIANNATHALYVYTPYTPTQAALNAYPGAATGSDKKCASYGNRNFWFQFNAWFGSTQYPVRGKIQKHWLAKGGMNSRFGAPQTAPDCDLFGEYCIQHFTKGAIASTKKHGSFKVSGTDPYRAWKDLGATYSSLGFPFNTARCGGSGACWQRFTHGYVVIKPNGKVRTVEKPIAKPWRQAGGPKGTLGFAKKNVKVTKHGNYKQKFAHGWIVKRHDHPAVTVTGDIATKWRKKRKKIKNPRAEAHCTKNKKGTRTRCLQRFVRGWVVSRTGRPTRIVRKRFADTYGEHRKKIGYPVRGMHCKQKAGKKVCRQKFTKRILKQKEGKKIRIKKR